MTVASLMDRYVISAEPDDSVRQVAKLLLRHNIGSIPICGEGRKLRGIITDRDITLRCIAADADPDDTPAREIMTRSISTISPDDDIRDAAREMASQQVRRLPVVSAGKLVGMLSLCDIARLRPCLMEAAAALSEISSGVKRK